jgi:hypothetical protein
MILKCARFGGDKCGSLFCYGIHKMLLYRQLRRRVLGGIGTVLVCSEVGLCGFNNEAVCSCQDGLIELC